MVEGSAKAVKVAWNKHAQVAGDALLAEVLDPGDYASLVEKANSAPYPAFELSADVYVELPAADWGHGDLLVYLPKRGWLARRNYVDHWYIDLGVFRQIEGDLYGWTDLWLDVVLPESASTYQVLDVDEFAEALRAGRVSTELAVYALENLHHLLETVEEGSFPTQDILDAQAFANQRVSE